MERHGFAHTAEYAAWAAMKQRCLNPKHPYWKDYGARGITICQTWLNSFSAFYADMGPRPAGKSIDRFPDNNGPYCKANCRWATDEEQMHNKRPARPVTARTRAKMSVSATRRHRAPFTPAHLAALSVAALRRWARVRLTEEP